MAFTECRVSMTRSLKVTGLLVSEVVLSHETIHQLTVFCNLKTFRNRLSGFCFYLDHINFF